MVKPNEFGQYVVNVDGQDYEFHKWGADDSLDTLIEIAKIVGAPLAQALNELLKTKLEPGESLLDKHMNPELGKLVLDAFANNLDKAVVKRLIKKFCSEDVLCKGAKISFDQHYRDRLVHMFKVVKAGVEVQYGNFFDELKGLGDILPRGMRNIAPASPT